MMEERELFENYGRTHDPKLRNEIVEKYLYIPAVIAKKFAGRGVEYDDLYQVAALALVKGVDRFDPSVGVKFSTFITPTITGEIKNYFRDHSRLIHLPRRVADLRIAVRTAAEELTAEKGATPTSREIAERLHVSEEDVVQCYEAGGVISLDRPDDDEGKSLYERIASDDSSIEAFENRDFLAALTKDFKPSEKMLLKLRYEDSLSQTETARRMHVSQMYVSRLERKLLERLRRRLGKEMAE